MGSGPLSARFYRNTFYGEDKDAKSIELNLGSLSGTDQDIKDII